MDARLGKFSSVAEVECVDVYLKTIFYLTIRLGQGLEIGSCELPQRGRNAEDTSSLSDSRHVVRNATLK